MKHGKLVTWLAAASLGICAAAFAPGLTAEAATGSCTINGISYSYDTTAKTAKVTSCASSLTSVSVPASINPSTANSSLPNVSCSVTEIAAYGLWNGYGNMHYTSVSLPSSLQRIGFYAFAFTDLTSITVPANVTFVDQGAFRECEKLQTVTLTGATELSANAFANCPELTNVQASANSFTRRYFEAFVDCPKLTKVNGKTVVSYQTVNGHQYPVLNSTVSTAILNHFSRSVNVKFVNDYCKALCDYIVATETDPWMNDGLKARQLHDWLVRHCEYEDCNGSERLSDSENQVASSVFLSFGLNVRGQGIGETVCAGYTKAYTMLLSAAGVESYPLETTNPNGVGHAWNLVKIGNKYYETDVTWDDHTNGTQYGTMYTRYLKSDAAMQAIHDAALSPHFDPPSLWEVANEHEYLRTFQATSDQVAAKIASATESFTDSNSDGILDYDLDLDGNMFQGSDWQAYNGVLQFMYGYCGWETLNNKQPQILYYLHQLHQDFWTYVNNCAPTNQTVHAGQQATFKVTMFGDQLTFQWKYRTSANGQWITMSQTGNTLSFTATAAMNGRQYICTVTNKNGNTNTCYPVTLTVI